MNNKLANFLFILIVSLLINSISVPLWAAPLKGYYTRTDYKDEISGKFADIVVELDSNKKVVFSRESSYLPYYQTQQGKWYLDEIVERTGDGTEIKPDKYNRFSYVRIIEQSPRQAVIHWRYYPDFKNVKLNSVVHEIFTITPNGTITRRIKKGTEKIDDWQNPENTAIQILQLKANGIEQLAFKKAKNRHRFDKPINGSLLKKNNIGRLAAQWKFNEGAKADSNYTRENISGIECSITGPDSYWIKGVSGTALEFDGYTSSVSMPLQYTPRVMGQITIEAWVAMDAHPFGWVPIIQQALWGKSGFYLGVDAQGRVGFMASCDRKWQSVISEEKIKNHRWTHIAVTVNDDTGEVSLYIDGQISAKENFGRQTIPIADKPLVIGLNSEPLIPLPTERYGVYGQKACITGFEGAIDEVTIYNGVLSPEDIKKSYSNLKPEEKLLNNPGFEKRVLPGKPGFAEKFGAYYTKLKYHSLWDNLWRTSNWPDIVVKFDQKPTSVIFWRGPSYGPGWVTEKNLWLADQSVETGNSVSYGEHMSDKKGIYTHVRLIENTDARVVIHWRYNVCDVLYGFNEGFGDAGIWVDEYFSIYPDGIAVRKVNQRSISYLERPPEKVSWQDVQFFAQPGMTPKEVMNMQAADYANLKGDTAKADWSESVPDNPLPSANIERINFKSDYKVFLAFQEGTYINPWGRVRTDTYGHFMTWNHWPVAMIPSQGKNSLFPDRITHSALCAADNAVDHGNMAMYGFTNKPVEALIPIVKSWCNPPKITDIKGARNNGYKKEQRAYHLSASSDNISFKINASENNPIVNPCFVIKNWKHDRVTLKLNGKQVTSANSFRQGMVYDTDGEKMLVTWTLLKSEEPVEVSISQLKKD